MYSVTGGEGGGEVFQVLLNVNKINLNKLLFGPFR